MDRITKYSGELAVIPHDRIKEAAARLASYENTGLTPEEITDGQMITGWIPVDEKLPDRLAQVICCNKDGVCSIGYIRFNVGTYVCKNMPFVMQDVVAWIPLPKPYQPENQH